MPWIDYRELRRQLTIEEVLAWMGWRANFSGGDSLRGSCPFCGDRESVTARNFVVHRRRHIFNCFGCHRGGDVLKLWRLHRDIDHNPAAMELRQLLQQRQDPASRNRQIPPSRPPA